MRPLAEIEDRVCRFFEGRAAGVAAVYLFGSVARGTATRASDLDVAVLFASPPPRTLAGRHFDLEANLQETMGMPVQLVVLNDAPCDLVHRVLRDGRLLVDRDPSARIRFEVQARNEYFDLKPFLDRYRRVVGRTPAAGR